MPASTKLQTTPFADAVALYSQHLVRSDIVLLSIIHTSTRTALKYSQITVDSFVFGVRTSIVVYNLSWKYGQSML